MVKIFDALHSLNTKHSDFKQNFVNYMVAMISFYGTHTTQTEECMFYLKLKHTFDTTYNAALGIAFRTFSVLLDDTAYE